MILREFDLWIPKRGIEERKKFNNEIRCIASLYARYLGRFDTDNCRKIFIECVDVVNENKVHVDKDGICELQVKLDIDKYFNLSRIDKKKQALEVLIEGVDKVIKEFNWDKTKFDLVNKRIIENDYINHWVWKKPLSSPDRKHKAIIKCMHEIDDFIIQVEIIDNDDKLVLSEDIIHEIPDEFYYAKYFGCLKWKSKTKVALISKNGKTEYSVEI